MKLTFDWLFLVLKQKPTIYIYRLLQAENTNTHTHIHICQYFSAEDLQPNCLALS